MDLRDSVILIILAALLVFLLIGTGGKETPIDEIEHVDEEDLIVETKGSHLLWTRHLERVCGGP